MKKVTVLFALLAFSRGACAGEFSLTQAEVDQIAAQVPPGADGADGLPGADGADGADGLPGADGAPGANGTVIMQADDVCFADIGGQMREWPCPIMVVGPDPDPDPDPPPPPPVTGEYVGIPRPSFGIAETVADSDFTHWVDNSVACTNGGNGTPIAPRCSVPGSLSAGDVVQIHGGPYSEMRVSFNGTEAAPIFFRGPAGGKVAFQGREGLELSGQYFIIENVDINRVQGSPNFYAVRDSVIHEPQPSTGGMISGGGHDVVYLRNEVFGNCNRVNGLKCTDPGGLNHDKDRHGFNIGGSAYNWWILENEIHHNGGDGIQFCHSCVSAGNGGPGAIYIANNVIYSDKENAIDLKEFTGPVIISGNDMSDYFRITSGQGETIRVNDEGNQGELWIIRNHIHDSNICIGPDDSDATSYAVDNTCDRNRYGILGGLTDQAGNSVDGVSDGVDPGPLYDLFERSFGRSIRPGAP